MSSSISNSDTKRRGGLRLNIQRFLEKFLIPFLVILFTLCYMLDRVVRDRLIFRNPSLGAAKIHRIIHNREPEVAILGSSRALGSYLPDSLGRHFHNYGMNGAGFEVMDMLLKIECGRSEVRSPILLNFDFELWNRSLGDINNYIPNIRHREVKDLLKSVGQYELWYEFYGIRFFSNYDSYIKDYLNYRTQLTKVMSRGASLEKNKLAPALFNELIEKRYREPGVWLPKKDQVERLLGHFASRRDRMFFVVAAPYHRSYYESFEGLPEARAFLADLDTLPNVKVVEIDGTDYPDSLFVNTSHINYYGSLRFTRELRYELFGKYGLDPDSAAFLRPPGPYDTPPKADTAAPDTSGADLPNDGS